MFQLVGTKVLEQLERLLACILHKKIGKKIVNLLFVCPEMPYRILSSFKTLHSVHMLLEMLCILSEFHTGTSPRLLHLESQAGHDSETAQGCGTGVPATAGELLKDRHVCRRGVSLPECQLLSLHHSLGSAWHDVSKLFWFPDATLTSQREPCAFLFLLAREDNFHPGPISSLWWFGLGWGPNACQSYSVTYLLRWTGQRGKYNKRQLEAT